MEMKKLFVSDLDGTLLNDDAKVSSASARIISDLSRQGALISFATARTPATVDILLAKTFTVIPAIVFTGAAMWNRTEHRYENTRFIDGENADEAIRACRSAGLQPFVYTLGNENILQVYHQGALTKKEEKFVYDRRGLPLKKFHIDEPDCNGTSLDSTILILAMGDVEAIFSLAEFLKRFDCLSISAYQDSYNRSTGIIEILGKDVSKASAVERLKVMTGAQHLTVFGDNLNDLPMMRIADVSVATANAVDAVKEAADVVIGSNNDDSVARYILENLKS